MQILGLPDPTDLQYDLADFLQTPCEQKLVEGYRGIGKSLLATAWSVHEHRIELEDHGETDLHTLYVSAGKDYADEISTFAKRLISEVPFYQCLSPGSEQMKSNIKFDVGYKKLSKDPSFKSAGIFGQTTGSRTNRAYLDDVEIPKTSGTVGMRDKLKTNVQGVNDLLPPEGGQIVVLGTPHFEDTIYNWLLSRGDWMVRIYPARYPSAERAELLGDRLAPIIRERLEADPDLVGKPTDPKRFDEERLQKREARSTPAHFGRQYLLDTSIGDKEIHPLKLADLIVTDLHPEVAPQRVIWGTDDVIEDLPIWGMAGDRFHRPVRLSGDQEMSEYTGGVMAIDPSGRGKDETAWAIAKILNATVFIPDFGGYLAGFEDTTLRALAESAKQWRVNAIRVETNFGDGMFEQLLKPHLRAVKHPCQIISERSSGQKERRVCDILEPLMNQHRLVIDTNALRRDAAPRDGMGEEAAMQYRFAYQASRITRQRQCLQHDDRIEVIAMAAGYWVEHLAQTAEEAMALEEDSDMDDVIRNWAPPPSGSNWTNEYIPSYMRR
tara:strand:- start:4471 stop:6126 length:1656 start_codon:yes stop_codon:yes gene_type:complete